MKVCFVKVTTAFPSSKRRRRCQLHVSEELARCQAPKVMIGESEDEYNVESSGMLGGAEL
jgi:hypothetical protein